MNVVCLFDRRFALLGLHERCWSCGCRTAPVGLLALRHAVGHHSKGAIDVDGQLWWPQATVHRSSRTLSEDFVRASHNAPSRRGVGWGGDMSRSPGGRDHRHRYGRREASPLRRSSPESVPLTRSWRGPPRDDRVQGT